jgi:hypothetical protein
LKVFPKQSDPGENMYKFIKNFLKPKEPEKLSLLFDAIPAWLDEREKTSRVLLETETKVPIQNIRNATAQLQHIVNSIADAEHDPAIHPKLKSIAKNSLPLFVKAMNASLSKDLPDDIEGFYSGAVECVKGCLNSTRGQGRYLQVVFPEEMKAVKTGIDAIGREMNAITTSLTTYRKQKDLITKIRTLYDALLDIRIDTEKSIEKDKRITTRIAEITYRLTGIEKELRDLSSDAGMKEVDEKKSALAEIEKKRDEQIRAYTALSMAAAHVFRKAEKIATKQRHATDVSALRHTIDLLSDHTAPDSKDLASALATACPVAQRMIEAGEILLKNKEERAIFSDTGRFSNELCAICTNIITHELAGKRVQDSLSSDPVLVRMNSLEREKTQLEYMLGKEHQFRKDLAEWSEKTQGRIPALIEELHKKIEEIGGGSVQLQIDGQFPGRE